MPTHVIQYQNLTKTHNQKVCSYKNETPNQKYLDGELFRKGPSGAVLTSEYRYSVFGLVLRKAVD